MGDGRPENEELTDGALFCRLGGGTPVYRKFAEEKLLSKLGGGCPVKEAIDCTLLGTG